MGGLAGGVLLVGLRFHDVEVVGSVLGRKPDSVEALLELLLGFLVFIVITVLEDRSSRLLPHLVGLLHQSGTGPERDLCVHLVNFLDSFPFLFVFERCEMLVRIEAALVQVALVGLVGPLRLQKAIVLSLLAILHKLMVGATELVDRGLHYLRVGDRATLLHQLLSQKVVDLAHLIWVHVVDWEVLEDVLVIVEHLGDDLVGQVELEELLVGGVVHVGEVG